MKKYDGSLFQIGEVTKILGITRKTLLVFENAGLLTPAVKDTESGYRYYSADNMTQIRSIRSLQSLGLTLSEIKSYYYDTENIDAHLQRLTNLRTTLDRNIHLLQLRAAKRGDLTIRQTTLPQQVCFCQRHLCKDVAEAASKLRDTYIAAVRTGKLSTANRMFTMRLQPDKLDIMCCLPVDSSFSGPERVEFAETPALCVYYRGPYEGIASAIRALQAYVKENNIETTGPFRSIYLEGPPNRGAQAEDYITQVAVPIKG